ncbi:FecCD family ABC transporter permease [Bacillus sp. Marseille-P3661]|uniref:FecCD family ABC transporter permease n=1 Tax=Bacillus sp. Marseille-P3661 TaxID=1936234 RepID=UPI000C86051F|nr:iron ABC transporter permease [Bacillus sp. Marseille-P3661]
MKKYSPFRLRKGKVSFLIDKKAMFIFIILLICTLLLFLLSTGMGDMKISPLDVIAVIFGQGTEMHNLVVKSFRLPRILVALLVGMALAVSGAILQGIVRNPLASPDILGLTGGASVAVVGFLAIFSDKNNALTVSIHWMPLAAFIGATVIAILIYILAWDNGVSPIRLVLVGIGLFALTQAITTLLMILGPIYRASQANIWLTGSVYGSNWENVTILAPWTLLLLFITFVAARHINIQELGDSIATGVGSNVNKQRLFLLLLSTGLTGGAVAFAGGIGFVGLMAPHIARRLVGSAFGGLLPVSALVGAVLVMLADLIGRTMFGANEVPAGIFTAAIGAPYFIYLLFKTRNM